MDYQKLGMNVGHFQETWRDEDVPQLTRLLTPFNIVRFMDWQSINASAIRTERDMPSQTSLAQFKSRARANRIGRWSDDAGRPTFPGVPVDTLLEMSKLWNVRPWICIPHMADRALIRKIITQVSHASGVKRPIIEYSNEVWNTDHRFMQHKDCHALIHNFTQQERDANEKLYWEKHPTMMKVLAWQARQTRVIAEEIAAQGNKVDLVIGAQMYEPRVAKYLLRLCGDVVHAVAVAPYIGMRIRHADNKLYANLLDEVNNRFTDKLHETMEAAAETNTKVWGYEGGLHLMGPQFKAFNQSVEGGRITRVLLDTWFKINPDSLICLYYLASEFRSLCWGHVELANHHQYEIRPKYSQLFV